jgi:Tol biopolymer transport system component
MISHQHEQPARFGKLTLLMVASVACADAPRTAGEEPGCEATIVFDRRTRGISEVFLLDTHSGETNQLTRDGVRENASRLPDLAPGGEAIVFLETDETRLGRLVVMDSSGATLRPLLDKEAFFENPAWSPRGDWIAFEIAEGEDWGLYIVRPDGSDLRRVGPEDADLFHPDW